MRTEEYVPNERKDEPLGKQNINEVEISSFYDKELKLMVINVITDLGGKDGRTVQTSSER